MKINRRFPNGITIKPSPTADTRSCDWATVSKETLLASSHQHIDDVREGFRFWMEEMAKAALEHDHDKISGIDHFHFDFQTGFQTTGWWDNHRKVNRHHLLQSDGVPADVNLVDVFDLIIDCVMAGMARSGSVYDITIPDEVLKAAFANTVEQMKSVVKVKALSSSGEGEGGGGESIR